MAKRKKKTELQKAVTKQKARINKLIKKYEQQGFDVKFKIPEQERATKKYLQTLKDIKYIDVLQQSFMIDVETGELIKGWGLRVNPKKYEGRNIQSYTGVFDEMNKKIDNYTKSQGGYDYSDSEDEYYSDYGDEYDEDEYVDPDDSDIIISNFIRYLNRFPEGLTKSLFNWLTANRKKYGDAAVGAALYNVTFSTLEDYLRMYDSDEAVYEYADDLEDALINYLAENTGY